MEEFSFELLSRTPPEWTDVALRDFDAFLQDHATCERKASAVGMSFVVRYPDRPALIEPMIQFAREELEHFHQVYRLLEARQLRLPDDEQDIYVNLLLANVRTGRDERLLDRLITSSLIEARGHERLTMVADRIEDPTLKNFYARLSRAEGHHKNLFVNLALNFFSESVVRKRTEELLVFEAKAIESVPFRSAIH